MQQMQSTLKHYRYYRTHSTLYVELIPNPKIFNEIHLKKHHKDAVERLTLQYIDDGRRLILLLTDAFTNIFSTNQRQIYLLNTEGNDYNPLKNMVTTSGTTKEEIQSWNWKQLHGSHLQELNEAYTDKHASKLIDGRERICRNNSIYDRNSGPSYEYKELR